tara:strand:- start:45329 stop:46684 length:1356 start_codon:yes stop_codon:yes gene_type:complete
MIKIASFIVFVGAASALAVFIVNEPGHVEIEWGEWLITTSPGALAAGIVLILCIAIFLWQIFRWLLKGPSDLARVRHMNRQRRGYRALTHGFVSAAAGDGIRARRLAKRAKTLLNEQSLTLLLSAQAAQLEGDERMAADFFKLMLGRAETEFLGLRGLLIYARQAGEHKQAREISERAYRIRPDVEWVLTALIELRARDGDYLGALKVLKDLKRNSLIGEDLGRRRRAALLVEASNQAKRIGDDLEAQRLASRAADADPDFVPAAISAAEISLALERPNAAARVIERCWRSNPHPILATTYRNIISNKDALAQMKRFERLAMLSPDHPESHIVLASAALEAKLWGPARKHLLSASKKDPNARVYRLLARLEVDENNNNSAAHDWLLKASEALPEKVWQCKSCGTSHPVWSIICSSCAALDTIVWGAPSLGVGILDEGTHKNAEIFMEKVGR